MPTGEAVADFHARIPQHLMDQVKRKGATDRRSANQTLVVILDDYFGKGKMNGQRKPKR